MANRGEVELEDESHCDCKYSTLKHVGVVIARLFPNRS
jgi:hypothetical protein